MSDPANGLVMRSLFDIWRFRTTRYRWNERTRSLIAMGIYENMNQPSPFARDDSFRLSRLYPLRIAARAIHCSDVCSGRVLGNAMLAKRSARHLVIARDIMRRGPACETRSLSLLNTKLGVASASSFARETIHFHCLPYTRGIEHQTADCVRGSTPPWIYTRCYRLKCRRSRLP